LLHVAPEEQSFVLDAVMKRPHAHRVARSEQLPLVPIPDRKGKVAD
jgi:hypothetical protein